MHHPTDRIAHTTAFVTLVVDTGWNKKQLNGSTPWRIDLTTHRTMSKRTYHRATSHSLEREVAQWVHPKKDRSDDPSHRERTLLPRSYISLLGTRNSSMGPPHEGSIRRPIAPWANALTTELHLAPWNEKLLNRSTPWRIDPTIHRTMSKCPYHRATSRSLEWEIAQ